MKPNDGVDRSVFTALTTVGSGIRLFDTPAHATEFLYETAEWWRKNSLDIRWHVPAGRVPTTTLQRLREMRDAVQALVNGDRDAYERGLTKLAGQYSFRMEVQGGSFVPVATGWEGFVAALIPPLRELGSRADRLRRCANHECYWLFLDTSRNGSRTWCHSSLCGNKMRLQRFRDRHRRASHP